MPRRHTGVHPFEGVHLARTDAAFGEREVAMDAPTMRALRRPPGTLQGIPKNSLFLEIVVSTARELAMCVEVHCIGPGAQGYCRVETAPLLRQHSACLAECT